MKVNDVIYVNQWAIGNPRAVRLRVESVSSREQTEYQKGVPTGSTYTIWAVIGTEVVKSDFSPRRYFGRKFSQWRAHLLEDDFEVIG